MEVKCPRCKKYAEWNGNKWRPFCSQRCKQIDLASWADEEYRIPEQDNEIRDAEEKDDGY